MLNKNLDLIIYSTPRFNNGIFPLNYFFKENCGDDWINIGIYGNTTHYFDDEEKHIYIDECVLRKENEKWHIGGAYNIYDFNGLNNNEFYWKRSDNDGYYYFEKIRKEAKNNFQYKRNTNMFNNKIFNKNSIKIE